MALKFKAPEVKQQRLKMLVYGDMGSGKSWLCCAFPNVAYFDTEDTSSKVKYAKAIAENGGGVINTGDIDEIISQVKELMSTKHDFKTIVIDSLTVPYENLILEAEKKVGSEYGRHIAEADKKIKQLVNLLLRVDCNIIVTCQSKKEYGSSMNVVGHTFAGYKRLGYMFDLVFETSVLGSTFNAMVRKSRLDSFVTGEKVAWSYEEVKKRCGSEAIEKEVSIELLPSKEQILELNRLIQLLHIGSDVTDKWLVKANCDSFDHMPVDLLNKCIKSLQDSINRKVKE